MSVLRDLFTTRVNSTMMSINERFTYLQKNVRPTQPNVVMIRAKNAAQQQASSKNRRLAMQMERRLTAMAALKIKKKSIRQRLGIPAGNAARGNVRDRLSLPVGVRGRGRARARGRPGRNRGIGLRRSLSRQSLQGGNLQRSRSLQSLNETPGPRGRSRSRSRSRTRARTPSRGPRSGSAARRSNSAVRQAGPGKRFGGGRFGQRQRGSFRGGRRRSGSLNRAPGNQINKNGQKNQNFRGNRGRNVRGGRRPRLQRNGRTTPGQGRNRILRRGQRGRGGSNPVAKNVPSREELDKQLDQYMANTKTHLDRELDTYMKESNEGDIF